MAGRGGGAPGPDGRDEAAARSRQARPVFTGDDLSRLEQACAGRSFQQRRDAAVIAVFRATGIRLSELAEIRYDHYDPQHSDIDLQPRKITVHGKGGLTGAASIAAALRYHARRPSCPLQTIMNC
jgi:site-specific recombinase XerC